MMIALRRRLDAIVKDFIVAYLFRCGGAFHSNPYGPTGRYVVVMNERQYHEFMDQVQWPRSKPPGMESPFEHPA